MATARLLEKLHELEETAGVGWLAEGSAFGLGPSGYSAGSLKSLHEFLISASSFEEYALYGEKGGELYDNGTSYAGRTERCRRRDI